MTGDPVVVLRQDLLGLRRAAGPGRTHVVLALPATVEVIPFLAELWRARVASGPLTDFYDPAPVVVGVDPATFMADLGCVHRSVRLWNGRDLGEPLTTAETVGRQVESADAVVVRAMPTGDDRKASGAAALIGHLNGKALVVTSPGGDAPTPASLAEALPSSTAHAWQARLEPVLAPRSPRVARHGVESVLWRARRPLHPGRLADALDAVMHGVVRGLGHLWLCSSPDAVVSWHSAGAYLELREADRWLEAHDTIAAARYEETVIGAEGWADSLGLNRPLDAAVSTT